MGNFIIGAKVTAIGFSTVFLVLIILMVIIQISGSFMAGLGKKSEAAPKVAPATPTVAAVPAPATQDNSELIAVITAAIAACGSTKRIKSITRVNGTAGAAWTVASRAEAMNRL